MKRRILLVDDDVAILLTLKALLEINSFDVETATSAREAKLKLRSHEFHMVITDMRMENETAGKEVVAAARKAPYQPAVAMLTAYPVEGFDGEEGVDKMLVKPMNTSDLLRQIEALLVTHEDDKHRSEPVRTPIAKARRKGPASAAPAKPSLQTKPAGTAKVASAR